MLLMPAAYTAAQTPISYPPFEPAVDFDAVLELAAGKPASIFPYGQAPSQYAERNETPKHLP